MTFDDLLSLQQHIQHNVGYHVVMGNRDIPGNVYPVIRISLDGDFDIIALNERSTVLTDMMMIKVIVEKDNELEAFRVRDLLIEQLGTFSPEKGMTFSIDRGSREYTDATFEMTIIFQFKNILQNVN